MPFPALRSRPSTSASSSKRRSTIEDSPKRSGLSLKNKRDDSFKKLSLQLSGADGEPFNHRFTLEPEEIGSPRQSIQDGQDRRSRKKVADHKSANTPAAASRRSQYLEGGSPSRKVGEDEGTTGLQRFSLLRFRHSSDPQLSTRFKDSGMALSQDTTPAPTIITTAPTSHRLDEPPKKRQKSKLFGRSPSPLRSSTVNNRKSLFGDSAFRKEEQRRSQFFDGPTPNLSLDRPSTDSRNSTVTRFGRTAPPAYGDETNSQLAIPVDRLSDSSRSDGSSAHNVYAQTTTTHTISTTTTFFKLKRRKKDKGPLFPLPERFPHPSSIRSSTAGTPRQSAAERRSMSPGRKSTNAVRFDTPATSQHSPSSSLMALTNAPFGSPGPIVLRKDSSLTSYSGSSTPSASLLPPRVSTRGRSSTLGTLGTLGISTDKLSDSVPPSAGSARTSTSTSGRRSFGDLLSLPHRLRQNSAPPTRYGQGHSPSTPISKPNSLQIPRETEPELVYPRREEGDTPASYLEKLEAAVPRGVMATILCKSADDFSKTCLRKYMRGFSYFGESVDMAIRKMLMEVELPKETQQIDRLLAGFADRYHECNPGIFASADEAGFVAFSILLLHSDTHNKNNKRKMQKADYVKNTQHGQIQVASDILECFYDNICYTPFIHFDDEVAVNTHRMSAPKPKKSLIRPKSSESLRGPVDPYTLLLDNKLDFLRPSLKDVMDTEDTYRSSNSFLIPESGDTFQAFAKSAVLQIVSARSRPDAFTNQATITNPAEAQAGLVSIKIAKVGFLWRKDPKKKRAKSPWQEWGALLTDSKLYFFKDVGWVKKLVGQHEQHAKVGNKAGPLVFKPPLSTFEPDALIPMDDAVALIDTSYKKHKNAFTFIKHGGLEEVFLANSEAEMNDWMSKLNYAATFRTAGVRMRGFLASNYEAKHISRKSSQLSTRSTDTQHKTTSGINRKVDPQAAWEIMFYRQQLIHEKISDFDEKIHIAQKELDNLLRNARHLLILLPIQAKTRESVILAAGRMSAKLKWTRVELWRTRTHRDTLIKDLEHEGSVAFPAPGGRPSIVTTPQKTQPIDTNHNMLGRTNTDTSRMTLSPTSIISSHSRTPSQGRPENLRSQELSPVESSGMQRFNIDAVYATDSPRSTNEKLQAKDESNPDIHSLVHQASIVSSHRTKSEQDKYLMSLDDPEEQILREAGVIGLDGTFREKRPGTSESERDKVGAMSPNSDLRERGGSVRRSLQRTLRDGHKDSYQGHGSPNHHRHKKGRESGSSLNITEDGIRSVSGESDELKRGTGSFILHGKKASVITMSQEWRTLSNEDRLRAKREELEKKEKGDAEDIVEDETESHVSRVSTNAGGEDTSFRNRKQSIASMSGTEGDVKPDQKTNSGNVYGDMETINHDDKTQNTA